MSRLCEDELSEIARSGYLVLDDGISASLTTGLYPDGGQSIKIAPRPSRFVIFDSAIEHEVLTMQSTRWSLTTWFRSDIA